MLITYEIVYLILFFVILIPLAFLIGKYMFKIFTGKKTILSPIIQPVEKFVYKICDIDEDEGMDWKEYAYSLLVFNFLGIVFLFVLFILQGWLPLNPDNLPSVRWDTALNTAISFVTNTNWQSYSGENTMSYLSRMMGLTVENFLSAAVGIATLLALIRGFTNNKSDNLGNFWVDITRIILYVLLPISVLLALLLVSQGVVQTINPSITAVTIEGGVQQLSMGPVASQEAIKLLGSNGGGFFNVNSAHPFENPNYISNFIESLSILLLPISLIFTFGFMVRNLKEGLSLFMAIFIIFILGLGVALWAENILNPNLASIGVSGQNLEGKELRFGVTSSVLWGSATTAVSNGGVNFMFDSSMPLTGLVYLFNIASSEVIFGGVGSGLIGILFYVILTMFISGLMIGRTPEYLGKKLGPEQMKLTVVAILLPPSVVLVMSAIAILVTVNLSHANYPPHGLTQIIYAFASTTGNNGSAFSGLNVDTVFYNLITALTMLIGRFVPLILALAIAGSVSKKGILPATSANFPSTSVFFALLLAAVIFIVGVLTFFPVFALGPILDHFLLTVN
ncbi:MAG: potassium-transporting ATPase subunit KdpA [Methanobacteriaceae archaeon]|nr:potassium-transporting ATPase subunit KdpA [Methanobacteriaceae archaeon]